DKQYEALQEQYELQQEQRDIEIQIREELINQQKLNGHYWRLVDQSIKDGPTAIENILTNTNDYLQMDPLAKSTKLDEWKNQLTILMNAYNEGLKTIKDSVVEAILAGLKGITIGGGNGNNSGDRDGGSSGNEKTPEENLQRTYQLIVKASNPKSLTKSEISELQTLLNKNPLLKTKLDIDGSFGPLTRAATELWWNQYLEKARYRSSNTNWLAQQMGFSKGGLVDYTGPAQVHGSKTNPEAFLNSDQTRIFAGLRDFLEHSMNYGFGGQTSNNESITVGDITVNLANRVNSSEIEIGKLVRKEIMDALKNRSTISIPKAR
ncbi:MAG: hypothetical protein M0R38_12140, partial [Bacteroidia bacterium]|nr:hypothetical protein [Bacteroidia bacterium]